MALLILNPNKTSYVKVADNEEDAVFMLPNFSYYQDLGVVYDISSEDKEGMIKSLKFFAGMENDAPVISDIQEAARETIDASVMSVVIQEYITEHKEMLELDRVQANPTYKQMVENNISLLEGINVDTIPYPINTAEEYLIDNPVPNLITGFTSP